MFPDRIGTVPFREHHTWYRVNGSLLGDGLPLVVLHGGPGAAHNYCLPMAGLADRGRAVVLYDQVGCGNSTHLPDADPGYWTVDLFIEEFHTLLDHLGISDGYHLLGQSWGGMLAAEIAVNRPTGLRSLTIADSPASMALWSEAAASLADGLPAEMASAIRVGEATGRFDTDDYRAATTEFYRRHVCRVEPVPVDVQYSFAQIDADPTVYHAMNGPTEFTVIGSLANWSIIDRVGQIQVPTLVLSGRYDEATPLVWEPFVRGIPNVRSHVFPNSSHMPHVEETDAFLDVVEHFLASVSR